MAFFKKLFSQKKIYSILIFIIIVALAVYYLFLKGNGETPYEIHKVAYGNVVRDVVESGVVKSVTTLNLDFKTQGKVAEVKVKAGDKVAAGRELVVLDRQESLLQVMESEAALAVARAKLDKILAGATPEDIRVYETAVANAEINLKNKEQALADTISDAGTDLKQSYENALAILKNGYTKADDAVRNKVDQFFDNPQSSNPHLVFSSSLGKTIESERFFIENILSAWKISLDKLAISNIVDADIALGKQNLSRIKSFLDTVSLAVNNLIPQNNVSQTSIDTWKAAVATARTNVDTAWSDLIGQEQIIAATKITNQTNINTARAAVDTASANLKTAEDQLALKKAAPQEADIALYKAQVRQADSILALNRERLSQTVLKSPIDGIVSKVDIEIGEMSQTGKPVISMDSLGKFQIEVDIYEEDIPYVKTGNPVDIEFIAFPDEILKGGVLSIEPAEKIVNGVVYYKVKIGFNEEKEGIKTGMTADVTIKTDFRENVLAVPRKAVYKKDGIVAVEIFNNGAIEERSIAVGLEGTNDFFEVISGLKEGDEVIIR